MKEGLREIVGREIAAVIVGENPNDSPAHQVFLVFTDGFSFEFYGDAFNCCGGVDRMRDIGRYIASAGGKVAAEYTRPKATRVRRRRKP